MGYQLHLDRKQRTLYVRYKDPFWIEEGESAQDDLRVLVHEVGYRQVTIDIRAMPLSTHETLMALLEMTTGTVDRGPARTRLAIVYAPGQLPPQDVALVEAAAQSPHLCLKMFTEADAVPAWLCA